MRHTKVQRGCRTSRGRWMNTLPATWNREMVRATRFLMMNITIRSTTWRVGQRSERIRIINDVVQVQYLCTETYRENCSTNGIHKQGLHIVWAYFLPKHWYGAIIEGIPVVHIEPPENSCPACKRSEARSIPYCIWIRTMWLRHVRQDPVNQYICECQNDSDGSVLTVPGHAGWFWELPIEPMITKTVKIHTNTLEM